MSAREGTVVLVHGAWHGSWAWERVVPLLEGRGFSVRAIDLPSHGGSGGDLSGDAAAVRELLDEVAPPILLCGHSYGGMPVTQAAAGHPGVERLVYLCAFVPDEGESLVQLTGGEPAPWIRIGEDGTTLPDAEQAGAVFYADCDPETQARAVASLRPVPAAALLEPARAAAWKEIPATYTICALDQAIPVDLQRDVFAPRAQEVVELESSHSPFFSQPAAVADLLASRF